MTNTLFPTSEFSLPSLHSDSISSQDIQELLRGLQWKKGIAGEIQELLQKNSIESIAKKLKAQLCSPFGKPKAAGKTKELRLYGQSLLTLLDYLAIKNVSISSNLQAEQGQTLPALLQELIKLNNSKLDNSPEQQIACETWLAELHSLLAHEWSQVEPDLNTNISQSKLIDLYLLTNILLLSSDFLPDELFMNLWILLLQHLPIVRESLELPFDPQEASLESMITRSELPCLFGIVFEASIKSVGLFRAGKKSLAIELSELTDTDGTPHASLLPILPQYFASVMRSVRVAKWFERKLFSKPGRARWEDLIERAAAITFSSGQLSCSSQFPADWKAILLDSMSGLSRKKRTHWAMQTFAALDGVSPGKSKKPSKTKTKKKIDQTASTNSAWAHLACLRNNWYPGADLMRIAHHQQDTPFALCALGQSVFDGNWQTELQINGEREQLNKEWTSSCWFSDETGDFIELRNETDVAIIDRQLFLSRTDHIALLCDTVFAKEPANQIDLRWELPLVGQWKEKKRRENRELFLEKNNLRFSAIPLGLSQDRVIGADGVLDYNQNHLCLNQSATDQLTMPLFFDWSPARNQSACDWCKLTVTESRTTLSASDAFAARCRIGKHQWLYLRNMEFSGLPRAVLGLHTDAETIIAEFPKTGIAEKLVEVHYDQDDE